MSSRGDHAFVGVLGLDDGAIRWMDPSVDRDGGPVWSPDGRRLAFIRVPNERARLPFAPRREALPWSIRVADAATGASREVFRAREGTGSAFQGVSEPSQLWWGAGDLLVLPWERQGWLHLWSVPAGDAPGARVGAPGPGPDTSEPHPEPIHLTRGGGEVQFVTLTPDREHVVYAANHGDIDRKHLWRVAVEGGAPELLTPGDGIEWSPVVTAPGGTVVFLASGPRTPAHPAVLAPEGRRRLDPTGPPDPFPTEALVTPEPVVFEAEDGVPVHGQLFLPPDLEPVERRPAVMFFHGGSRRQMLLGFHHRGYYHNAYALNQYLASRGYVVLAVNYRSGIGYGMEFREALDYGARGASEYRDVVAGARYLRGRSDVDPERIGLWGGSYGGYLTALGLARDSDLFAAGVDLHGVHDWNVVVRNFVPSYSPEERDAFAELAFEASPLADVDTWRSPVLLIHGDDDRNVPFSESVDLAEELRRRGVHVEELVFPDEVHGFLLHRSWLRAYRAAAEFLERTLGEG